MSDFTQLVTPNPNVPGESGMCLEYVQNTFKAPAISPSAHAAYDAAQYKHTGLPPTDISVPVWFSMTANPDWHVALWNKGAVYSVSDKGVQNFVNIANLLNYMNNGTVNEGMAYLGWSEDIETLRVVEEEVEIFNEGDRVNLNVYLYGKDKGLFKSVVGQSWKTAMSGLFKAGSDLDFEYKVNDGDVKNINTILGASNASTALHQNWKDTFYNYVAKNLPAGDNATVLKPGNYKVQ